MILLYIITIIYRTAKGNHPVTFAVAACETQNVNVTVLPSFGLSEGTNVTAKEMWGKMAQVFNMNMNMNMSALIANMHFFFKPLIFSLLDDKFLYFIWKKRNK